ncbi:hypothetical protein M1145_00600 [Patescibacteria group bacterium]|nr:hypothetical protein [Patescibacteria group bacterium]
MANNNRNLKYEIEIMKAHSKKTSDLGVNHIDTSYNEFSYVKGSLIKSLIYILLALIVIFIVSLYTSTFTFDQSLRSFFHIHRFLL